MSQAARVGTLHVSAQVLVRFCLIEIQSRLKNTLFFSSLLLLSGTQRSMQVKCYISVLENIILTSRKVSVVWGADGQISALGCEETLACFFILEEGYFLSGIVIRTDGTAESEMNPRL